jgi:cytochrome oxidase Cu insertion factor (SCO1/SenC/PrrC family)
MTRRTKLALGGVAAVVVVSAGGWLASGVLTRDARSPSPRPSPSRGVQVAAGSLADLMMDLELIPIDGQTPKPFTLENLDGKRVALADLAGRPALLYFWATW